MDNKTLKLFIEAPEREFYVREIARIMKKSPTTISKYLKKYEKDNILKSEKKFNHLVFKANDSEEFRQIKLSYNLKIIKSSGLVDFLVQEYEPETIILFGSFAKAENNKRSDIDLLLVTGRKKEINLEKFEEGLGHKIQLFVHSKAEIEKIKEKNPELLNNWINGIKLYGYLGLFK